jgi:Ca-activated chloride channel family protein
MTDVSIDWGSMHVTDVYPQILPDLIVGRPITVTGRFSGEPGVVKVGGRSGSTVVTSQVVADTKDAQKEHRGIAAVWARLKIADLMAQTSRAPGQEAQLKQEILQTALDYSLMSPFTAFVAVDSMTKTEGKFGTTVAVPVPTPEGARYDTTVNN